MARAAFDLAPDALEPAIVRHSVRSFLFAALTGESESAAYDVELLFVSTVLHDLGLALRYRSPDGRFEADGANAARRFLLARGVAAPRAEIVWDAIALHDVSPLARHKCAEVRLCSVGVGTMQAAAWAASRKTAWRTS